MKEGTARLERDLAHTIRRLYERGLVSGVGGNASVLLPSGSRYSSRLPTISREEWPKEILSG